MVGTVWYGTKYVWFHILFVEIFHPNLEFYLIFRSRGRAPFAPFQTTVLSLASAAQTLAKAEDPRRNLRDLCREACLWPSHDPRISHNCTMKVLALFATLFASAAAVELTPETWDEATAGKTIFVKFLAPW